MLFNTVGVVVVQWDFTPVVLISTTDKMKLRHCLKGLNSNCFTTHVMTKHYWKKRRRKFKLNKCLEDNTETHNKLVRALTTLANASDALKLPLQRGHRQAMTKGGHMVGGLVVRVPAGPNGLEAPCFQIQGRCRRAGSA